MIINLKTLVNPQFEWLLPFYCIPVANKINFRFVSQKLNKTGFKSRSPYEFVYYTLNRSIMIFTFTSQTFYNCRNRILNKQSRHKSFPVFFFFLFDFIFFKVSLMLHFLISPLYSFFYVWRIQGKTYNILSCM